MSNPNPRKRASSTVSNSAQLEQEETKTTNHKKNNHKDRNTSKSLKAHKSGEKKKPNHKKWKPTLILNSYMGSFIKKASKNSFYCEKCKKDVLAKTGKDSMWCENMYEHILSSTHETNTALQEKEKLLTLRDLIEKKTKRSEKQKEKIVEDKEALNVKNYLSFTAFLIAERLSYCQISRIGNFLKKLFKEDRLSFLNKESFDEEVISKLVSRCFAPSLLNQIHKDLEQSKFSFSIDTSTMVGESICAIRAKYLKEFESEDQQKTTQIMNKIVGLATIKESSDASVMLNIVKSKLLVNKEIEKNLVGLTHDMASALSSEDNGLADLLKKTYPGFLYNLDDPCHCLSKAVEKSLPSLPDKIMDFVEKIHHYFSFPQRKAALKKLQGEKKLPILLLKKYADTRWLSLGESLQRLLEIWPSLQEFFKKNLSKKSYSERKKIQKFSSLLNNTAFKLKIQLLSYIINQINTLSEQLQNHFFSLGGLKTGMKKNF